VWRFEEGKVKNINIGRITNQFHRHPLLRIFHRVDFIIYMLQYCAYSINLQDMRSAAIKSKDIYSIKSRRKGWRLNRCFFSSYIYTLGGKQKKRGRKSVSSARVGRGGPVGLPFSAIFETFLLQQTKENILVNNNSIFILQSM